MPGDDFQSRLIASSVDEPWRNQEALLQEFPFGLAPFTRANLLAYTFLGSLEVFAQPLTGTYGFSNVIFPASIVAAGIAGAISLRRSNQSSAVPRLLLTTLILTLVCALIGTGIIQYSAVADPDLTRGYTYFIFLIYLLVGALFALHIARQQQPAYAHWQALKGLPARKQQGGCLNAFGWLAAMNVINFGLILSFYMVVVPFVSGLFAHPVQVTEAGVTLTVPAGWVQIPPKDLGCTGFLMICITAVREPTTGVEAVFASAFGADPSGAIRAMANAIRGNFSNVPEPEIKVYKADSLIGHEAVTTTLIIPSSAATPMTSVVLTGITFDRNVVSVLMQCSNLPVTSCEARSKQFIDSMQFAGNPHNSTPGPSVFSVPIPIV